MSFTYHISYNRPYDYTICGEQTKIQNVRWIQEIEERSGKFTDSIAQLTRIRLWIKDTFLFESNKGATIGTLSVDQLYTSRVWHGCHDLTHLFAATIRHIGYPCIIIETTSVLWSKKYANDRELTEDAQGHNLTEVYVNGKWILFDPMSLLVLQDYDYNNPFIPSSDFYTDEPDGFYVIAKGKDCWDYGVRNLDELIKRQKDVAQQIFEIWKTKF